MQGNEKHFPLFMSMSSLLTGYAEFDLFGTGCAELYYKTVATSTAGGSLETLLSEWETIQKRLKTEKARLETLTTAIKASKEWFALAQNLVMLWYMGQWTDPGTGSTLIPSPNSYVEGLAWPAMQAHVEGGKEEGFAMWAALPGTTQLP